jgi:hypothetical protein
MMGFASFLVDHRRTYNYYSTLSFTSDKLYSEFGREASKNFTEMSQRIETMVSSFASRLMTLGGSSFSIDPCINFKN